MEYHSDEWRKIEWLPEPHEILTSSADVAEYPPFKEYIDMIKSGQQKVSKDIHDLIKIIEKHLYPMIDDGRVYMDLTMTEDFRLVPANSFPYDIFPWESFLLPFICGFRFSEDDILVFNEYFLYMARGAGKNGFMSWVIYALISKLNGIEKYDVAVSASSERQAKTSFTDIHGVLAKADPKQRSFKRTLTEIVSKSTKSKFHFLSSNGKTADGLRLGAMYLDEIHAIEDYAMMKVLRSSLGKIPDARMLITTTDGYVRGAVLDGYKDKAHSILNEERGFWFPRDDRRFSGLLPFMHHIDTIEEATTEEGWQKANPTLLHNRFLLQIYRQEVVDMESDAELNIEFHCKRVNFPKNDNRYAFATLDELNMTSKGLTFEQYCDETGRNDVIGVVDYSQSRDLTSVGLMIQDQIDGDYYYLHHSFITREAFNSGQVKPSILKRGLEEGKLTVVESENVDPEHVRQWFSKMGETYYITHIYIDQYRTALLKPELERFGFNVIKTSTNMKNETTVLPVLDDAFINHKIHAGEDFLFRWAVNNMQKEVLQKGVRFGKIEYQTRKTDPFSAFITGLIGWFCYDDEEPPQTDYVGGII